ncbi:hypothetical protein [Paracoccus contaminans]|nr:hypothetical protein [Paracoccus contaminans]
MKHDPIEKPAQAEAEQDSRRSGKGLLGPWLGWHGGLRKRDHQALHHP